MTDLGEIQAALPIKIIGSSSTGLETNPVQASANNELRSNDCINTSAIDTILNLTTVAQEVKVGANRLTERKYIWMQAIATNIKWGFDTNCRFDLFRNQLVIHPVGNVPVYMKMSTGTGTAIVAEGA